MHDACECQWIGFHIVTIRDILRHFKQIHLILHLHTIHTLHTINTNTMRNPALNLPVSSDTDQQDLSVTSGELKCNTPIFSWNKVSCLLKHWVDDVTILASPRNYFCWSFGRSRQYVLCLHHPVWWKEEESFKDLKKWRSWSHSHTL